MLKIQISQLVSFVTLFAQKYTGVLKKKRNFGDQK